MKTIKVTPAEFWVAHALLWDGASNETIAKRRHITGNTVESHMRALLRKTDSATRTSLVVSVWSRQIDLVKPNGTTVMDLLG